MLLFDTSEGLGGFMKLYNHPIASKPLVDGFSNYALLPPRIVLGEVRIFDDIDALTARGNELIEG